MPPLVLLLLIAAGAYLLMQQRNGGQMAYSVPASGMTYAAGMQMSERGVAELIRHEGFKRQAYPDSGGLWTIGVGHLIRPGDGLLPQSAFKWEAPRGMYIVTDIAAVKAINLTDGQVYDLFAPDLGAAENRVRSNVSVPVTQGMYDALVDFSFNVKAGQFETSTLLQLLNSYNYEAAAEEFPKWIYTTLQDGSKMQVAGLANRRDDERKMFLT
jgi:lysozyme